MALTIATDIIQPANSNYISFEGVHTGMPLAVNVISSTSRTALSAVTGPSVAFSGTFTKLRSDTIIRATCTVFGAGFYSGNCGVGLVLDYGTNTRWDYGVAYQYDGAWIAAQQTTLVMGHCQWSSVSAGSHTIGFGWNPADSSSNRPYNYLNPNSSDDGRNGQFVSTLTIYETA